MVVLIIGILAAVALPQYERAVLRSKFAGIKPVLATVKEAVKVYYLENEKWPTGVTELGIEVPSSLHVWIYNTSLYAPAWTVGDIALNVVGFININNMEIGLLAPINQDIVVCCGNAIADPNKVKDICNKAGFMEYTSSSTGGLQGCYK